ncbi:hypothetical protein [Streptomyces sp. NPDC059071]|uniref:hypothetical protein n=1 Tax=unclassified Streptomyces TaxID=2593676 RepID=UPI0036587EEC
MLNSDLDHRDDIVCDVHGGYDDVDQEAGDHAATRPHPLERSPGVGVAMTPFEPTISDFAR